MTAVRVAAVVAAAAGALLAATQLHVGDANPQNRAWCTTTTSPNVSSRACFPTRAELLAHRLIVERHQARERTARAYRAGYHRARREALQTPDAHIAARLAALAYGQSASSLLACARSEGYREAERYHREIPRRNKEGSGATGPWQFMPSTFASTPQGKAGLPITRVDVQAHAAAWMWQQGRRGEWTGRWC